MLSLYNKSTWLEIQGPGVVGLEYLPGKFLWGACEPRMFIQVKIIEWHHCIFDIGSD